MTGRGLRGRWLSGARELFLASFGELGRSLSLLSCYRLQVVCTRTAGMEMWKWERSRQTLRLNRYLFLDRFSFLSRSFNYSSRALSIAVKVSVSQLVFAPLFSVYFFGSQYGSLFHSRSMIPPRAPETPTLPNPPQASKMCSNLFLYPSGSRPN